MKEFNGKVLFLDRSDINTDEIIPARYLTEITKEALIALSSFILSLVLGFTISYLLLRKTRSISKKNSDSSRKFTFKPLKILSRWNFYILRILIPIVIFSSWNYVFRST